MKEKYIELMEKTLSAYSLEHIVRYFDDVKRDGLTEHGFPRLTSNIGILIFHGKRTDLLPLFCEMMDFCCESIPKVKAANDFSVREIICCVREIEQSQVVEQTYIDQWKNYLVGIDPPVCYTVYAKTPEDKVKNWALFTGVSEFFRQDMGLCDSTEFIDTQLASQFQWIDENGMYMDNNEDIHHPMTYDLVPIGLFCLLLNQGYNGKYREKIDGILKKAGLLTLKMQSPNGEIPFGGDERPLRDTSVENANIKFAKLAGLKKIRIHDFRHSHVSLLANEGINIQEIARRLGHANIEMTWNTYSHLYPREEERAIKILNKIV